MHRNLILTTVISSREEFAKMAIDGFSFPVAGYPAPLLAWLHLVLSVAAGISCCSQVDSSSCSDLQQTHIPAPYPNFGLGLRLQYCSCMEVESSPKTSQRV